MNSEDLHIGVSEAGGDRILRLTGELDSYTSENLRAISNTWILGAKRLVVNLDNLEYIDSAGLSALVSLWLKARENNARMVVSCRSPRVHRVLEITGLLNFFTMVNTPDTATPARTYSSGAPIRSQDLKTQPQVRQGRT